MAKGMKIYGYIATHDSRIWGGKNTRWVHPTQWMPPHAMIATMKVYASERAVRLDHNNQGNAPVVIVPLVSKLEVDKEREELLQLLSGVRTWVEDAITHGDYVGAHADLRRINEILEAEKGKT